jgi:hypothetical protein
MNSPSLDFQPLLQVPPPSLGRLVLTFEAQKLETLEQKPLLVHQQAPFQIWRFW